MQPFEEFAEKSLGSLCIASALHEDVKHIAILIHSSPKNPFFPTNNAAYPKAAGILPEQVELRQVKYLNNLIEQDHRFIKRLTKPGMGFSPSKQHGEPYKALR